MLRREVSQRPGTAERRPAARLFHLRIAYVESIDERVVRAALETEAEWLEWTYAAAHQVLGAAARWKGPDDPDAVESQLYIWACAIWDVTQSEYSDIWLQFDDEPGYCYEMNAHDWEAYLRDEVQPRLKRQLKEIPRLKRELH